MDPPLEEDLGTADFEKFVDLLVDLLEREDVGILILAVAVESTEFAVDPADIRVVDVTINDEGGHTLGMELFLACCRHAAQLFEIGFIDKTEGLFFGESLHKVLFL
jgi:hypothetical protein